MGELDDSGMGSDEMGGKVDLKPSTGFQDHNSKQKLMQPLLSSFSVKEDKGLLDEHEINDECLEVSSVVKEEAESVVEKDESGQVDTESDNTPSNDMMAVNKVPESGSVDLGRVAKNIARVASSSRSTSPSGRPKRKYQRRKYEPVERSTRHHAKPARLLEEEMSPNELRCLHQAIQNSRQEYHRTEYDKSSIPMAPTFRPSIEEFKDPIAYIASISHEAEKYGVVKIQPPKGWNPPQVDLTAGPLASKKFPTKKQAIHKLQEGEDYDDGRDYTVSEFESMSNEFQTKWIEKHYKDKETGVVNTPALSELEKDYWRVVGTQAEELYVEYGNDLDVEEFWSGFPRKPDFEKQREMVDREPNVEFSDPEYYSMCRWNLNTLPFSPGSILRIYNTPVKGVTIPWLYMGMLFSTFAWHNEDNFMYSINYLHRGAPKQWYGIPGSKDKKFEDVGKQHLHELLNIDPSLWFNITTMLSPDILRRSKVPVTQLLQEPGDFVVTYPKSYHAGLSYGFNMGEAVNFALPEWIRFGKESAEKYRIHSRPSCISQDRIVFTLCMYLQDYDLSGCKAVLTELQALRDEEIILRKELAAKGVKDISSSINLPKFSLRAIEPSAAAYDERRSCKECQHMCFMSAIGCHCTSSDIVCLRHEKELCGCPPTRKFFFFWMSLDDIHQVS